MTTPMTSLLPMADLLGTVNRLTEVLEQENRALKAGDPEAVRQLGRAEAGSLPQLRRGDARAGGGPSAGAGASGARAELRAASARLALAAAENQRRLAAAIAAHKRLLELVGAAMVSLDPNAGIYASTGAAARGRGSAGAALSAGAQLRPRALAPPQGETDVGRPDPGAADRPVAVCWPASTSVDAVARNVANVNTPGYSRKIVNLEQRTLAGAGAGVAVGALTRRLDQGLLDTLRRETGGLHSIQAEQDMLDRVQDLFGTPESDTSLSHLLSSFQAAIESLAANPADGLQQREVVRAAADVAESAPPVIGRHAEDAQRGGPADQRAPSKKSTGASRPSPTSTTRSSAIRRPDRASPICRTAATRPSTGCRS